MNDNDNVETQQLLKEVALAYLKDQRQQRRWRFVKRMILLSLIFLLIIVLLFDKNKTQKWLERSHVALINVEGTISDQSESNANSVIKSMRQAYKDKLNKAVIFKINSPGGSPVQADYIYNEIIRYRKLYPQIKVYAVCTDMCASAAYYVASAADYIYANQASLVGSIGVLYNGFGFVGTLQKLGVERRLVMAGSHKGFLDPFSPINMDDEVYLHKMLDSVHQQFELKVKEGRGSRLKITPEIFTGLIWTGTQAKELGLIDDFGSAGFVAREIVKAKLIINYSETPSVLDKLSKKFGGAFASELLFKLGIDQPRIS